MSHCLFSFKWRVVYKEFEKGVVVSSYVVTALSGC